MQMTKIVYEKVKNGEIDLSNEVPFPLLLSNGKLELWR